MEKMIHHLSLIILAPVFLLQGLWVRRNTPVLAEPEGDRAGVWGIGPDLRLLIVGDSAAAGVGVGSQAEALSGQLVAHLGERYRVHWQLLATSGHDSAEVLVRIASEPDGVFDVAVISVGVNDVTGRTPTAHWDRNLQAIANVLGEKFQVRNILFSCVPPMHVFPALPQPLRWWLGARAKMLNQQMKALAASDSRCRFVDIAFPLEDAFMADDGFHPGAAAYALWGEQLARVIVEIRQ